MPETEDDILEIQTVKTYNPPPVIQAGKPQTSAAAAPGDYFSNNIQSEDT